jgi:hypothetical protein
LLAASGLLNDLNETRLQLLNDWNVVGEDTHVTRLCGDVDLDTIAIGNSASACHHFNHFPSHPHMMHILPISPHPHRRLCNDFGCSGGTYTSCDL